jgi:trimethylamine--corrinoid protein Co-methyltransferase
MAQESHENRYLRILDDDSIQYIHHSALRILSEIGVRIHDRAAVKAVSKAGADGDEDTRIVRIPEFLIQSALKSAPSEITLYEASGRALCCQPGRQFMGTQGYTVHIWDFAERAPRIAIEQDTANWARLADALPDVHIVQPVTQDTTVSPLASALRMAGSVVMNTRKHFLAQPLDADEAEVWHDITQIIAGPDQANRHPMVTFMATSNSPLQLDAKNATLLMYGAEHGIPIAFFAGPLAGANSPFTLAGTLAQQLAETLAALTLHQITRPGAPFILGMASSNLDMRTGNALYASIEYSMLKSATGQFARYYQLPYFAALGMADSVRPDIQAGIEKAITIMVSLLSGANFTSGSGSLATATTACFEQLVIDHEIYQMVRRFWEGISVNETTLAFDVIRRVGIGGNFLTDRQTLEWMRSGEHYLPQIANRSGALGSSMLENAHHVVTRALSEHRPDVPEKVALEVSNYVGERLNRI